MAKEKVVTLNFINFNLMILRLLRTAGLCSFIESKLANQWTNIDLIKLWVLWIIICSKICFNRSKFDLPAPFTSLAWVLVCTVIYVYYFDVILYICVMASYYILSMKFENKDPHSSIKESPSKFSRRMKALRISESKRPTT